MGDDEQNQYAEKYNIEELKEQRRILKQGPLGGKHTGMKTKVEALHFVVAQALGARPVKGGIKGGK